MYLPLCVGRDVDVHRYRGGGALRPRRYLPRPSPRASPVGTPAEAAPRVTPSGRPPRTSRPPRKRVAVVVNPTKFDDLPAAAGLCSSRSAPSRTGTTRSSSRPPRTTWASARPARPSPTASTSSARSAATARCARSRRSSSAPASRSGCSPAAPATCWPATSSCPSTTSRRAMTVALTGRNRHIDVGWLTLDPDERPRARGGWPERTRRRASARHAFFVMAGLGLDAAIMDSTSEAAEGADRLGRLRPGRPAQHAHRALQGHADRRRRRPETQTGPDGRHRQLRQDHRRHRPAARTPSPTTASSTSSSWRRTGVAAGRRSPPGSSRSSDRSTTDARRATAASRPSCTVDEPQRVQVDGDIIGEATARRASRCSTGCSSCAPTNGRTPAAG